MAALESYQKPKVVRPVSAQPGLQIQAGCTALGSGHEGAQSCSAHLLAHSSKSYTTHKPAMHAEIHLCEYDALPSVMHMCISHPNSASAAIANAQPPAAKPLTNTQPPPCPYSRLQTHFSLPQMEIDQGGPK